MPVFFRIKVDKPANSIFCNKSIRYYIKGSISITINVIHLYTRPFRKPPEEIFYLRTTPNTYDRVIRAQTAQKLMRNPTNYLIFTP